MRMVTNRRRVISKNNPDFYPTPSWATKALLKYESFENKIAEFCCGEGDISRVLKKRGYSVYSADLYDRGYGEVNDALLERRKVSNIITNPPFNIANILVPHFETLYKRKMCLLLRTAFLESVTRYELIFKLTPPARIYIFTQRLSMYPKGQPVKGGGTTSYSWFVWDRDAKNKHPEIHFIEPGLKPSTRKTRSKTFA